MISPLHGSTFWKKQAGAVGLAGSPAVLTSIDPGMAEPLTHQVGRPSFSPHVLPTWMTAGLSGSTPLPWKLVVSPVG